MARFQLGLLQFCDGRVPAALLTWQALLQLDDEAPLKSFVEGFIALAADRLSEARTHIQRGLTALDDNPALSKDMQMVIDRINAASTESDHTPADYHFLLANYREAGKPH